MQLSKSVPLFIRHFVDIPFPNEVSLLVNEEKWISPSQNRRQKQLSNRMSQTGKEGRKKSLGLQGNYVGWKLFIPSEENIQHLCFYALFDIGILGFALSSNSNSLAFFSHCLSRYSYTDSTSHYEFQQRKLTNLRLCF